MGTNAFPPVHLPAPLPRGAWQARAMAQVRIAVRVKPGSSRTRVGGSFGNDELVVAVNAPPVEGAANEAVVKAVAAALGLRPRQVALVSGHASRSKVLEVDVEDDAELPVREALAELLRL